MAIALRDIELRVVFVTQDHASPLAKCGRVRTKIHRYIEDSAAGHAHKLGLAMRRTLKMNAAQHTFV